MNKERFIIIDDDPGISMMLQNIIEDEDLGQVVDIIDNGQIALKMIPKYKPDIVFIDLLLPDVDGIELVRSLKKQCIDIDFIMISQVSDDEMISDAYESGIEFYISKPINVIEIVSVTKHVIKSQRNRRVLEQIGNTLNQTNMSTVKQKKSVRDDIELIFSELGILSEKGSEDLIQMILYAMNQGKNYQVSELYYYLNNYYESENVKKSSSVKAIEQRVRRTIYSGLMHIAHIGIEDFGNYKFEKYASALFGFTEVKKAMDHVRMKKNDKPTINIKQFIQGIIAFLN